MAFQQKAAQNLVIANNLRKRGFDNLLNSQPDMRDRFCELWHEGISIKSARFTLKQEYTAKGDAVPSQSALQHYVNRYLRVTTPTVVIEPYTPDYTKLLRKFDAVVKAHQVAIEAEKLYQYTVNSKLSINTQLNALNKLMDINSKLYDLQVRSGIARTVQADNHNLAVNMQQTNVNVNIQSASNDEDDNIDKILERFERLKRQRAAFVNASALSADNNSPIKS